MNEKDKISYEKASKLQGPEKNSAINQYQDNNNDILYKTTYEKSNLKVFKVDIIYI